MENIHGILSQKIQISLVLNAPNKCLQTADDTIMLHIIDGYVLNKWKFFYYEKKNYHSSF